MKTKISQTLFVAFILTVTLITSTLGLQAQSWTPDSNGFSLTPTTANVGIGSYSVSDRKLYVVNNGQAATKNLYGLCSNTANSDSVSSFLTYGINTVVSSKNKGRTFGHSIDVINNNTSSTEGTYGIWASAKSESDTSPVTGLGVKIFGSGSLMGMYSSTNNTGTTTTTSSFGVLTNVFSDNKGTALGHSINVSSSNIYSTANIYGLNTSVISASSTSGTIYGVYSNVSGGNKRWAGYFTGGDMYVSGKVGIDITNPQSKLEVDGDIRVGINKPEVEGYGNRLFFFGKNNNSDSLWIARYNKASDQSELRINIGDDGGMNDKFSVGFTHWNGGAWNESLAVLANGNVEVLNGTIRTKDVKICLTSGCDFVFADDYKLMNLNDLSNFIKTNKHLPEVAPAREMEAEGINLSEMQSKLLQKIEELTLYAIEQHKTIEELKKEIKELKNNK